MSKEMMVARTFGIVVVFGLVGGLPADGPTDRGRRGVKRPGRRGHVAEARCAFEVHHCAGGGDCSELFHSVK